MKLLMRISLLLLPSVLLLGACSKDKNNTTPVSTKVEYRVANANNYIIQLQLTDSAAQTVIIDSVTGGNNWSTIIHETAKPFAAQLKVTLNNTSGSTLSPVLGILVADSLVAAQNISVPPHSTVSGTVSYTVQ